MKNLLTLVAALAITSAASAQSKTCTVKTPCGSRSYTTTSFVKGSHSGNIVTVTEGGTGAVLDTFECDFSTPETETKVGNFTIKTSSAGSNISVSCNAKEAPTTPEAPTAPEPTAPSFPDLSNLPGNILSIFTSLLGEDASADNNEVVREVTRISRSSRTSFSSRTVETDNASSNSTSTSAAAPTNETFEASGSDDNNSSFEVSGSLSEGGTSQITPVFTNNGVSVNLSTFAPNRNN